MRRRAQDETLSSSAAQFPCSKPGRLIVCPRGSQDPGLFASHAIRYPLCNCTVHPGSLKSQQSTLSRLGTVTLSGRHAGSPQVQQQQSQIKFADRRRLPNLRVQYPLSLGTYFGMQQLSVDGHHTAHHYLSYSTSVHVLYTSYLARYLAALRDTC